MKTSRKIFASVVLAASLGAMFASPALSITETKEVSGEKESHFSVVTITDPNGTDVIRVTESDTTVAEALSSRGMRPENYRTQDDRPVDGSEVLDNGEEVFLVASEVSATIEEVSIPRIEETKETGELFVGETKIAQEGKDGSALRVKSSKKTSGTDSAPDASERLVILEAPETKVTLVGTKERPAPPIEEVSVISGSRVSSNSQATANADAARGNSSIQKVDRSQVVALSQNVSTSASGDGAKAAQIALDQVGKAYVWGSSGPNSFDCSGLITYAYRTSLGYQIPRTANAIGRSAQQISYSDLQAGDILYTSSHIVMYIGDGKIVHSSTPSTGVVVSSVDWTMRAGYKAARIAN